MVSKRSACLIRTRLSSVERGAHGVVGLSQKFATFPSSPAPVFSSLFPRNAVAPGDKVAKRSKNGLNVTSMAVAAGPRNTERMRMEATRKLNLFDSISSPNMGRTNLWNCRPRNLHNL